MEEPKQEPDNVVHMATINRPRKGQNTTGGSNLMCTHCGEEGHSKLRCYEIINYPELTRVVGIYKEAKKEKWTDISSHLTSSPKSYYSKGNSCFQQLWYVSPQPHSK